MGHGHGTEPSGAACPGEEILAGRGLDTSQCGLACFSAAGFSDALRAEAARGEDGVLLIGLDELYGRAVPVPPRG